MRAFVPQQQVVARPVFVRVGRVIASLVALLKRTKPLPKRVVKPVRTFAVVKPLAILRPLPLLPLLLAKFAKKIVRFAKRFAVPKRRVRLPLVATVVLATRTPKRV